MDKNDKRRKNIVQWKKGQCGNPKGRPKIMITELKGQGLSKVEAYAAIGMMLKLSKKELLAVSKSDTAPVWKISIARAIMRDISIGHFSTVETLFDRLFGKAKQTTEIGGPEGGEPITSITIKYA